MRPCQLDGMDGRSVDGGRQWSKAKGKPADARQGPGRRRKIAHGQGGDGPDAFFSGRLLVVGGQDEDAVVLLRKSAKAWESRWISRARCSQ
jgi:hypothetical protein